MNIRERLLYHQIHPLKLTTDITTAAAATALLWQHRLATAIAIGFLPSILVSAVLVRWANLDRYRVSPFGRYIAGFMTRRVELARFAGLASLWIGAWRHRPLAIGAGVLWIAGCWLWGLRR